MKKSILNNLSSLITTDHTAAPDRRPVEPVPPSQEPRKEPTPKTAKKRGRPEKTAEEKAFRYTFVTDPELIEELKTVMVTAGKRLIKDAINEAITDYIQKQKRRANK